LIPDAPPDALAADGVALLVRHLGRSTLDPQVRQDLRDAALPLLVATMRCQEATTEVHDAFEAAGIRHAILKGEGLAAAWRQAFGEDLRTYTDVDILVAERDREAAVRVLTETLHGYEGAATAGETPVRLRGGAPVDLHWELLNDDGATRRHRLDTEELLDRVDLSGKLPVLHPLDALLHTCLHAVVSNGSRLAAAVDVAVLVRRHRYSAEEVRALAASHRAALAVAVMLDRAALVTGWPEVCSLARALPGSPWRALCRRAACSVAPSEGRRWTGAEVLRTTRTGTPSSVGALVARLPQNVSVQRHLKRREPAPGRVALISLEPWDVVWRRNQHLVHELVRQGLVDSVLFVEPPLVFKPTRRFEPMPGVTVVRPPLPLIRRAGGLRISAAWLKRRWLRDVDLLWINDPVLGLLCMDRRRRAVYDVTDDWRFAKRPARLTARILHAEGVLARVAETVVCSDELARRWYARYGVVAPVVNNAATSQSYVGVQPVRDLPGDGPHVGYVGTLHDDRLDTALITELATSEPVGTVHLVGPDALSADARSALDAVSNIVLHPPVRHEQVPHWLMAFDALLLPHLVSNFTLSLNAIKAFEYLATDRPVIATPTSGFQGLAAPGLWVVARDGYIDAVTEALSRHTPFARTVSTWNERARKFASAAGVGGGPDLSRLSGRRRRRTTQEIHHN